MNDTETALALALIVSPVALIVCALLMSASEKVSRFGLGDWLLVAAIIISWLPMVLGIVLSIGDGNPTVDIGYASLFTVIAGTLLLTRMAVRRREQTQQQQGGRT